MPLAQLLETKNSRVEPLPEGKGMTWHYLNLSCSLFPLGVDWTNTVFFKKSNPLLSWRLRVDTVSAAESAGPPDRESFKDGYQCSSYE